MYVRKEIDYKLSRYCLFLTCCISLGATCKQSLNLKNFKGYQGKIYCAVHTPKPSATTVTDSVAIKQALAAPKKTSEGLGNVQKGGGGKPQIAVFGGGEGGSSSTTEVSAETSYETGEAGEAGEAEYEEAAPADDTTYGGEEEEAYE